MGGVYSGLAGPYLGFCFSFVMLAGGLWRGEECLLAWTVWLIGGQLCGDVEASDKGFVACQVIFFDTL